MSAKTSELKKIMLREWPDLPLAKLGLILNYHEALLLENEIQNLTTRIEPADFFDTHLMDCKHLLESGLLEYPAVDLGSGPGIPGLVCGMVDERQWVLVESEKRKADFLQRMVETLSCKNIRVFNGRVEVYLRENVGRTQFESVVSRAVGPVDRIYGWISKCSTWNNLVLLKGPRWEEEWKKFTSRDRTLSIVQTNELMTGDRRRQIVKLTRVPRGTKN